MGDVTRKDIAEHIISCPECSQLALPVVVETAKKAGVPNSVSEMCGPKCDARHCECGQAIPAIRTVAWTCSCGKRFAPTAMPDAVQVALETRAMLLAAEKACEELGRKLSEQIRAFSGNELVAYAEATQGHEEQGHEDVVSRL